MSTPPSSLYMHHCHVCACNVKQDEVQPVSQGGFRDSPELVRETRHPVPEAAPHAVLPGGRLPLEQQGLVFLVLVARGLGIAVPGVRGRGGRRRSRDARPSCADFDRTRPSRCRCSFTPWVRVFAWHHRTNPAVAATLRCMSHSTPVLGSARWTRQAGSPGKERRCMSLCF